MMRTPTVQRLSPAGVLYAAALLCPISAGAHSADTQENPRDICKLLGGRTDRHFAGRPGNLYAVVGAKARLIHMAADLSAKSTLFHGKVVEWRPDYAHSYYVDLIMRHVVGIEADPLSDEVRIHPLNLGLERFEARNIWVKGHDLAVTWKSGRFTVSVDGMVVTTAPKLKPLKFRLNRAVLR